LIYYQRRIFERLDKVTDDELKKWMKDNIASPWHPVSVSPGGFEWLLKEKQTSSARMGKSEQTSVVDANLKVHGIQGLRVVDASVFPAQVSGHPCSVVIAVAERAADLIKRDHEEGTEHV
jgi:choline dehydrogenase